MIIINGPWITVHVEGINTFYKQCILGLWLILLQIPIIQQHFHTTVTTELIGYIHLCNQLFLVPYFLLLLLKR